MTTLSLNTDKMIARVSDGIGWMTFNNPARHNAMSAEMNGAIPQIVEAFATNPEVRVVVMNGAGGKAFVSGADISEFGDRRTSVEARAEYDRISGAAQRSMATLDKPLIAMIQGYCMGGGVLTAMNADIRIAADDAQFAVPAAKLGVGYGFGGVAALTELVGKAAAAEILFSARRYGAEEAHRIGLVNRVVPAHQLEQTVVDLASTIAGNAPLTIRAVKHALRELSRDPGQRDVAAIAAMTEACFQSADYREGQAAFLAKRPPRFEGR